MASITFTKAVVDRTQRGPDTIRLVFMHNGNPERITEQEARGTAEKWLKRVGFGQCTVLSMGNVQVSGGLFDGQETGGVVEEIVSLGGDDAQVNIDFFKAQVTRLNDKNDPDRINIFFRFPGTDDVEDLIFEVAHGSAETVLRALGFSDAQVIAPGTTVRSSGRLAGRVVTTVVEETVTL